MIAIIDIIVLLGIAFAIFFYSDHGVTLSMMSLQEKISKIQEENNNTLIGVPYEKFEEVCGAPNAVSNMGNGTFLKQWMRTHYHIALLFDENDLCMGITSEISV